MNMHALAVGAKRRRWPVPCIHLDLGGARLVVDGAVRPNSAADMRCEAWSALQILTCL